MKVFFRMILVTAIIAIATNVTKAQKASEQLRVNVTVNTNGLVDSDEITNVVITYDSDFGYGIQTKSQAYTGVSVYTFLIGGHGDENAFIIPSVELDLNEWRLIGQDKNGYFGSWSQPGEDPKALSVNLVTQDGGSVGGGE